MFGRNATKFQKYYILIICYVIHHDVDLHRNECLTFYRYKRAFSDNVNVGIADNN